MESSMSLVFMSLQLKEEYTADLDFDSGSVVDLILSDSHRYLLNKKFLFELEAVI